jgi:hypothetical protein
MTTLPEPFFQKGSMSAGRRRILLLSYHFPPGQAAGARRWQKLAVHAAAHGWELDVFTVAPGSLQIRDPEGLKALPEGIRVFGIPETEPRIEPALARLWALLGPKRQAPSLAQTEPSHRPAASEPSWFKRDAVPFDPTSVRTWARAFHAAMEFVRQGAWAGRAAQAAARVFEPGLHRIVVSCGPPHMVHHAGRRLARSKKIPLILDLRDPWSLAERVPADMASPFWYRLASHFESQAVADAALVAMNTETARDSMQRTYPDQLQKIISVTNGFDDDPIPSANHGPGFVLAYTGSIYIDRSPRNLFRAVRRVADELDLGAPDLRVELMGEMAPIDGVTMAEMARMEGVESLLRIHPPENQMGVEALLARAALLVSLPQDSHMAVPSKIFEYIGYPAWVMALAECESATGLLLAGTSADVVPPEDVDGIATVIREHLLAYLDGVRPDPIATDPRLGRRFQAQILFDGIEKLRGLGD